MVTEHKPIVMPPSFAPVGIAFWNWVYNDVFAHPNGPIRRQAHWANTGIEDIDTHGGVHYCWRTNESISVLLLWADDKAAEAVRSATTDVPRPPFSLLSRVWFDLAHRLGMLTDAEWEHLCECAEEMKPAERSEYGDAW
jgi:hypothetical protein